MYTRPELTKADLKAFQAAKCVILNPERKDILKALKIAEKSTRKHQLSPEEALAAFDNFTNESKVTVFTGSYHCGRRSRHPLQGTVLQLVRLTDSLTGLICDRQQVAPGKSSTPPLQIPADGLLSGRNPVKNLNSALTFFWPYLSDSVLDELHSQCSLYVMGTLVPALHVEQEHQKALIAQRKISLAELYREVKPEFTTEFAQQCQVIAKDLQKNNQSSIAWRDLKQKYPATSKRHQAQLLGILENNKATIEALSRAECQTDFDIRLTTWRGAMRLFDVPQLVLQLRNIPIHHRFSENSPPHRELSNHLKNRLEKFDTRLQKTLLVG